jgi:hypothetical protein
MQICNAEDKMRNSGRVSHSLYIDISVDCFHAHIAFKVARFNAESVRAEFPKIKTQADNNRKLGMNAGKVTGNNRIESADNRQFSAVFLGEITECKKFYFNLIPQYLT